MKKILNCISIKFYTYLLFLLYFSSLITACMHVQNVDKNEENTSSKEISLNLNRLNNLGGTNHDYFESIIKSGDYYIATGRSQSDLSSLTGGSSNQGNRDFVIAKFNKSDLSLVNLNNLGGTNPDYFKSVIESGDYYITVGYSQSDLSSLTGGSTTQGSNDFVIAKFNKSDLSLVNLNNLGGANYDGFYSVIESSDCYTSIGYSGSNLSSLTGGSTNLGGYDFVIAKFNKSDLSLVSINNLGGSGMDYFESVIKSGDYYITAGRSQSNLSSLAGGSTNEGSYDFVIAKFNKSDLSLVSINNLGGSDMDYFKSIIESGNYYITTGYSTSDLSSLTGGSTNLGGYDFVIAKFNKFDISLININSLGGTNHDGFYSVIESGDYYIATGHSESNLSSLTGGSPNLGNNDFVIVKFGD